MAVHVQLRRGFVFRGDRVHPSADVPRDGAFVRVVVVCFRGERCVWRSRGSSRDSAAGGGSGGGARAAAQAVRAGGDEREGELRGGDERRGVLLGRGTRGRTGTRGQGELRGRGGRGRGRLSE